MPHTHTTWLLLCLPLCLLGCGQDEDEDGTGQVQAYVYGESFIEEGIPAEEMGDGWSVTFDTFRVQVEDVVVGGVTLPQAGALDISMASDGSGQRLSSAQVPSGDHSGSSYRITRVEVSGQGSKDGVTKTFDWVLDQDTHYTNCETTTSVPDQGSADFQITVHADHLFYDSLVSEEPQVLFQALADADTDGDGAITQEELADTDIGAYDPGSQGGVDDLWTWLIAQSRTLGHVDGEGHCDATSN
jgi:hypothetical protein